MLNTISGFLGGAGAAVVGDYESIQTHIVGSGGTSSITFGSGGTIPQTYKHLQIRALMRSTASASADNARMRFNGDTGTNYRFHYLGGAGSGSGYAGDSGAAAFAYAGLSAGGTPVAGVMGASVIDILDYTSTNKNKTVRALSGTDNNGDGYIELDSSLWINTGAITSLSIFFSSANIAQYSHFALYGIKG